jgi:hypothetical protein
LEMIQGLYPIVLSGSILVSSCLLVSNYPMSRLDITPNVWLCWSFGDTFVLQNLFRGELPSSLSGIMLCYVICSLDCVQPKIDLNCWWPAWLGMKKLFPCLLL